MKPTSHYQYKYHNQSLHFSSNLKTSSFLLLIQNGSKWKQSAPTFDQLTDEERIARIRCALNTGRYPMRDEKNKIICPFCPAAWKDIKVSCDKGGSC